MNCISCKYKKDKTLFIDDWLEEIGLNRKQLVLMTKIIKLNHRKYNKWYKEFYWWVVERFKDGKKTVN